MDHVGMKLTHIFDSCRNFAVSIQKRPTETHKKQQKTNRNVYERNEQNRVVAQVYKDRAYGPTGGVDSVNGLVGHGF